MDWGKVEKLYERMATKGDIAKVIAAIDSMRADFAAQMDRHLRIFRALYLGTLLIGLIIMIFVRSYAVPPYTSMTPPQVIVIITMPAPAK